jgi:hypothetical protein
MSINLEDAKKGRIVIKEEGGKGGEIEISAQGGSAVVRTPEGTTTVGAGGQGPDWLPKYSGAHEVGYSATMEGGRTGTFTFKTSDSVEQVVGFYEREMPGKGFTVKRTASMRQGPMQTEILEASGDGRKARLSVVRTGSETIVSIAWE